MNPTQQIFGGNWTVEKLEHVRKYLVAYTTIMNKQPFRFAYIDAFAGTGYRILKQDENPNELMFPEIAEQEVQEFLDGSARIALQVQPRFQKSPFLLNKTKTDFLNYRNLLKLNSHYSKMI